MPKEPEGDGWMIWPDLLPQLGMGELAWIAGAGIATAALHTLCGFAGGILLSIVIAPVVGLAGIVPVMTVALLISASSRLWVFRRSIDWRVYRSIMITALPGITFGAIIYTVMPVRVIAGVLGIFLMGSVLLRRTLEKRQIRPGARTFPVIGAVFGVLSGGTVGAGMLLVPFLVGAGVVGERLAAMFATIGFTMNVIKGVVFASSSVLDWHYTAIGLILGLTTVPGTYAGYWLLRHTSVRVHTALVEALVVAGGALFTGRAFGLV